MVKQALCVNKDAYLANPTMANLLKLPSYLVGRDICDSKKPVDEVNLQLISYITIVSPDFRIFVYLRGKAGDESTLHDLFSVGVGGHVDELPLPSQTLRDALLETIYREIVEEIGVKPDRHRLEQLFDGSLCTLLHESLDPTNRVHLGVNFVYMMTDDEMASMGTYEVGVIEAPRFLSPKEIRVQEVKLEPWSNMVMEKLRAP